MNGGECRNNGKPVGRTCRLDHLTFQRVHKIVPQEVIFIFDGWGVNYRSWQRVCVPSQKMLANRLKWAGNSASSPGV